MLFGNAYITLFALRVGVSVSRDDWDRLLDHPFYNNASYLELVLVCVLILYLRCSSLRLLNCCELSLSAYIELMSVPDPVSKGDMVNLSGSSIVTEDIPSTSRWLNLNSNISIRWYVGTL